MSGDGVGRWCSSLGHEKEPAAGVVVLADCDKDGSCLGHPYCPSCMTTLSSDPYNTIVEDWRAPDPPEVPDIIYVDGYGASEALRNLADRFDADPQLVLIGLWNVESAEDYSGAIRLQVVVTHMRASGDPEVRRD